MHAIRPSPVSERPGTVFQCCDGALQRPATGEAIRVADDGHRFDTASGQIFPVVHGIPNLFVPNGWTAPGQLADVTEVVKAFYEETPFPNYDDFDPRESLRQKARRGIFAALLDEQIVPGARVPEAGCGTGQLSNFLGLAWDRKVFGGDLSLNSRAWPRPSPIAIPSATSASFR